MTRIGLTGCVAAGLLGLALEAASAGGEQVTGFARMMVWRQIFARPTTPPPALSPFEARRELGRDLFSDPRLSDNGRSSCATCHKPDKAFSDGRATAIGPKGKDLKRNVPHLVDLAWQRQFFWDARAPTLEAQALGPLLSPDELAADMTAVVEALSNDPALPARFAAAFPAQTEDAPPITPERIVEAIADYERSLVSPRTRFDDWIDGRDDALTDAEKDGFAIFVGKGGCVSCHGSWRLTDDTVHDIGVKSADLGRGALPGPEQGLPQFKTPSLRELTKTAPYMHDGSLPTLADVVDHYAGNLDLRPSLAPNLVRNLKLSPSEKAALIAFLKTLSSGK